MANVNIDIMRNFKFEVDVESAAFNGSASFNEISGFDATYDVAEYRAGDDQFVTPRKFPGLVKYGNITLKRGVMSGDSGFMAWLGANIQGALSKGTLTITLTDPSNSSNQVVWTVTNAWPVKYTGPDLNGNASEIAVETIEIAHEGILRDNVGGPGTTK